MLELDTDLDFLTPSPVTGITRAFFFPDGLEHELNTQLTDIRLPPPLPVSAFSAWDKSIDAQRGKLVSLDQIICVPRSYSILRLQLINDWPCRGGACGERE